MYQGQSWTGKEIRQAKREIKSCYDRYRQAVIDQDGTAAVACVDLNTIQYYDQIIRLACYADSVQLDSLNIIDKTTVFRLKAVVDGPILCKMEGRDLLAYSIDEGMIGKNSVLRSDIGRVKFQDSIVRARVVTMGIPLPIQYEFHHESKGWKVNICSILPFANGFLSKDAARDGISENQYVLDMISYTVDQPYANALWQPIQPPSQ